MVATREVFLPLEGGQVKGSVPEDVCEVESGSYGGLHSVRLCRLSSVTLERWTLQSAQGRGLSHPPLGGTRQEYQLALGLSSL